MRSGRQARVLVVDDEARNREFLEEALTRLGDKVVAAEDGLKALAEVKRELPDLIILDIAMPGLSGLDVCRALKQDSKTRLIPVVLLTALGDRETRIAGLEAGADDFFNKPCDLRELKTRIRSLLDLKRFTDELEHAETMITSLGLAVEARDTYTGGHCARLAKAALELGRRLGLEDQALRVLRLGGFLHDLGKISIPDHILLKPGPLTEEERTLMRAHPVIGEQLCQPMHSLDDVRLVIRYHHERWNGSGYPDSLAGDAIPLTAQILGLVDVYDALVTQRPYKPPFSREKAVEILQWEAANDLWNTEVLAEFVRLVREGSV
ncbi:MAG: HD-GYP domain-containing protein [Candidatus Methylomirabilia bacterium]